MRALLTPEIVPRLGVVLFKPGSELMQLFTSGRVLVEAAPRRMAKLPVGRLPEVHQPLSEDKALLSFFSDDRVIRAAGGLGALEQWLRQNVRKCQHAFSEYHHPELVHMRYQPGSILMCWHCDNILREQSSEYLEKLARTNLVNWVIDTVLAKLSFNRERELSVAELSWWAVSSGIADAIPESMARKALGMPAEVVLSVNKESDLVPPVSAANLVQESANKFQIPARQMQQHVQDEKPKILALKADPESPESFMLRPKRRRWVNKPYTDWVKTQPCECCRQPADDPHHIIGNGLGGTATKAHDLFVFPLCRVCHDRLHADVAAFERQYGTQAFLLLRFMDRALATGAIVKA